MNTNKVINFDFQGWPVKKMSVKDILIALGAELKTNRGNDYWEIPDSADLDKCPMCVEDDGMGYGANDMFISEVTNTDEGIRFWREKELEYVSAWLEAGITTSMTIQYNGKEWIPTYVDETDDGMVMFFIELDVDKFATRSAATMNLPISTVKQLVNSQYNNNKEDE